MNLKTPYNHISPTPRPVSLDALHSYAGTVMSFVIEYCHGLFPMGRDKNKNSLYHAFLAPKVRYPLVNYIQKRKQRPAGKAKRHSKAIRRNRKISPASG